MKAQEGGTLEVRENFKVDSKANDINFSMTSQGIRVRASEKHQKEKYSRQEDGRKKKREIQRGRGDISKRKKAPPRMPG